MLPRNLGGNKGRPHTTQKVVGEKIKWLALNIIRLGASNNPIWGKLLNYQIYNNTRISDMRILVSNYEYLISNIEYRRFNN